MMFFIPSSGGKNSIIVTLLQSHGILAALGVCLCVLATWFLIYETYFRHRFVLGVGSRVDPPRTQHQSTRSKENEPLLHATLSFDANDSTEELQGRKKSGIKDSHDFHDELEVVSSSQKKTPERRSRLQVSSSSPLPSSFDPSSSSHPHPPPIFGPIETTEPSTVVTQEQINLISSWLPTSKARRGWSLKYTLRRDGANLATLMALCQSSRRNGIIEQQHHIVLIEDSWGYIFGAYVAHSLEDRPNYYGSGESFVFSITPSPRVYRWTGENNFFCISDRSHSLAMGGGGGGFAFQLDDELDTGVSNSSATYGNERLSSSEFFKCLNAEVWTINDFADDWV